MLSNLYTAVACGQVDRIKDFLLQNKHNKALSSLLQEKDKGGYTLLHWAAQRGQAAVFRLLEENEHIDYHSLLQQEDNEGNSPLHVALEEGYPEIATMSLKNNRVVFKELLKKKNKKRETLTHVAAFYDQECFIKEALLNNHKLRKTEICSLLQQKEKHGMTPIHCAVATGSVSVLQLLLESDQVKKEILLQKNNSRQTPLHIAVYFAIGTGKRELLTILLESSHSSLSLLFQQQDIWGETPLHKALEDANSDLALFLFQYAKRESSAPFLKEDKNGQTVLHKAVMQMILFQCQHLPFIEALLNEETIEVSTLCQKGDLEKMTPLHVAVLENNVAIFRLFLESKMLSTEDIHSLLCKEDKWGWTPFCGMLGEGRDTMMRALLSNSKIDASTLFLTPNRDGKTPLDSLLEGREKETEVRITRLLLESDPIHIQRLLQKTDDRYATLLHRALEKGWMTMIAAFLSSGKLDNNAFLGIEDQNGWTPVHSALYNNAIPFVKAWLRDPKTNIQELLQAKDKEGKTPIHLAVEKNHHGLLQLLLQSKRVEGTRCFLEKDNCHRTPLQIAIERHAFKIIDLLLKSDIEGNILFQEVNARGDPPLHAAIREKSTLIAKAVIESDRLDVLSLLLQKNRDGLTVLHLALVENQVDFMQFLLENDKINCTRLLQEKNDDHKTPLEWAIENVSHERIADFLSSSQVNVHALDLNTLFERRDNYGFTIVHKAVFCSHYRFMTIFLHCSAIDINKALRQEDDAHQFSVARWALEKNDITMMSLLLRHQRVEVEFLLSILDERGRTFLDIAKEKGQTSMILELEAAIHRKPICFMFQSRASQSNDEASRICFLFCLKSLTGGRFG